MTMAWFVSKMLSGSVVSRLLRRSRWVMAVSLANTVAGSADSLFEYLGTNAHRAEVKRMPRHCYNAESCGRWLYLVTKVPKSQQRFKGYQGTAAMLNLMAER